MKKVLSILLALISVLCIAFTFGGCGEGEEEIETGYIYRIDHAYEFGMITYEQAKSIIYYFNVENVADAEMMYGDYSPLPKAPKKLTDKRRTAIKQAYLETMLWGWVDANISYVSIDGYYGTYDGYVAVAMSDTYKNKEPLHNVWVERFETFSGSYDNGSNILIWRECDKPVEVRGKFYTMERAYEYGWLDENDLKSIACCYYDSYKYEENPYSGLFDPHEELTEEIETELKQAYLEQFAEYPEGDKYYVDLFPYYGTYNGNVVAFLHSSYVCIDPTIEPEKEIGGVIFKKYWSGKFLVYHID